MIPALVASACYCWTKCSLLKYPLAYFSDNIVGADGWLDYPHQPTPANNTNWGVLNAHYTHATSIRQRRLFLSLHAHSHTKLVKYMHIIVRQWDPIWWWRCIFRGFRSRWPSDSTNGGCSSKKATKSFVCCVQCFVVKCFHFGLTFFCC